MILLLALFRFQVPEEGPPSAPRSVILEGVAVQAGDAVVTLGERQRVLERVRKRNPPQSREEELQMQAQILRELGTFRLEEQRGADLGLDSAQIERISRADLREARERQGLNAFLAELERQGKDALGEEADREKQILRYVWEESAKGAALPFVARRATRDQDVRPGELLSFYEENKQDLAPTTVQLRWLIVSSEALGGPDAARAKCEEIRTRVLAGEDLALFIEEFGAELRDTGGLTPFVPPKALLDPALARFAEEAELDELSVVMPLTNPKTGTPDAELGFSLARLEQRQTPSVPPFEDPEVQRLLRRVLVEKRNEALLGLERERLRRESYTWVNPLLAAQNTGSPRR